MSEYEEQCVLTGCTSADTLLLRLAVNPEREVVPDISGTLPSDGIWMTCDRRLIEEALTDNVLPSFFEKDVKINKDICITIGNLLRKSNLRLLGLAKRGGYVASGYTQVKTVLQKNKAGILLTASDSYKGKKNDLKPLVEKIMHFGKFTLKELTEALGTEKNIHAVTNDNPMIIRIERELQRLMQFTD